MSTRLRDASPAAAAILRRETISIVKYLASGLGSFFEIPSERINDEFLVDR